MGLLTRNGEPWIVLRAVETDQDWLSALYAISPGFRRRIEERRREPSIPWDEAKKQLDTGAWKVGLGIQGSGVGEL